MSFGAGGLAQMTYNPNNGFGGGIGLPGSGFASRGKAANIKRLSVAPPPSDEEVAQAPRTSRSHMLAGLRTQARSGAVPETAPATQLRFPESQANQTSQQSQPPQTAMASSFGNSLSVPSQHHGGPRGHQYTPSQVLSPPAIQLQAEDGEAQMDPALYEELVRTNEYLAHQQLRLKQQLIAVTQAANTMGISNQQYTQQQQMMAQGMAQGMGLYNQQMQQGLQPVVQPVPEQPGLYQVYNPMTGQISYMFDQNAQQFGYGSVQSTMRQELSSSPPPPTPTFKSNFQSQEPAVPQHTTASNWRSQSPPKASTSPPQDTVPLPPPSANAFRPGHKKMMSLAQSGTPTSASALSSSLETPRNSSFKQALAQGNFGPGQHREGDHPIRQPRGPPSLEELKEKPTTKFEGSKNFATRRRRGALKNLVQRGLERRGASTEGSVASLSPTSERDEMMFPVSESDADSVRSGSASLSGKPSLGSLRSTSFTKAIGSERKEKQISEASRERKRSVDSGFTTVSMSGDEGNAVGGNLVEIRGDEPQAQEKRKSTLLLHLANAEKRRNPLL